MEHPVAEAISFFKAVAKVAKYAIVSENAGIHVESASHLSLSTVEEALSQFRQKKTTGKWQVVPCLFRNRVNGYLILPKESLSEKEVSFWQHYLGLAFYCSVSEERLAHTRLLYEISHALTSLRKVREGLSFSIHLMEALFQTNWIYFLLPEDLLAIQQLSHSEQIGKLTAKGKSTRGNTPLKGERARKWIAAQGVNQLQECDQAIVLPLLSSEEVRGWLAIGRQGVLFTDEEERLLATLSALFASSLERLALDEKLSEQSVRDGLTNLYNHRFLQERFTEEVARSNRYGSVLSVAMFDLDHFKKVNDTYGHAVGDEVLKRTGHLLRTLLRESDVVARYGGEEFMVLFPETPLLGAFKACERLRVQLAQEIFHPKRGAHFTITASCGICAMPQHGKAKDKLIAKADRAMYRAKREGRNRICLA